MDQAPPAVSLLEELDRRQDEVLCQLEELEDRLGRILADYGGARPAGGALRAVHPLDQHQEAA